MVTESLAPDETPPITTTDLWRLWRSAAESGREDEAHDFHSQLVERHQPLVRFLAERMAVNLPRSVSVDDLMQEGNFGLMDALNKFDADRGIKFKTYCSTRIRGSILDSLRTQDWVPRLARRRARAIQALRDEFLERSGREPSDKEIAAALDLKEKDVAHHGSLKSMNSLSDRKPSTGDEATPQMDTLGSAPNADPFSCIDHADLMDVITKSLSDKERMVLQLFYIEDLNLREIGERLHITDSRVCQIRSVVLKRLRERLSGSENDYTG
jgi:RNA polymerase sigma factor for flagellar operon FliA